MFHTNSTCPGQFSTRPAQNALAQLSGRALVSLTGDHLTHDCISGCLQDNNHIQTHHCILCQIQTDQHFVITALCLHQSMILTITSSHTFYSHGWNIVTSPDRVRNQSSRSRSCTYAGPKCACRCPKYPTVTHEIVRPSAGTALITQSGQVVFKLSLAFHYCGFLLGRRMLKIVRYGYIEASKLIRVKTS